MQHVHFSHSPIQTAPDGTHLISSPPGRQTLPCHYIKFYFGNVQPASMIGNVMDSQLFGNFAGFRILTCRTPSRGSTDTRMLQMSFRIYSESFFCVSPSTAASWPSPAADMAFCPYTPLLHSKGIRCFGDVQDILHASCEFRSFFGRDAPVDIFMRAKFIF